MDGVADGLRSEHGVGLIESWLRDLVQDLRERREAERRLDAAETERLLRRLLSRGSLFARRRLCRSCSDARCCLSSLRFSRFLRRLPSARITLLAASSISPMVGAGLAAGRSLSAPATNLPINHASRWRALSCISK